VIAPAALALLVAAADLLPEEEARAEPSRSAVRLGEPFDVTAAARHALDEVVELEPPVNLGPFGLRASGCRTTPGERAALTTCTLELQLFALGEQEAPPIALRIRGPAGVRRAVAPGPRITGLATTDPATPAEALAIRPALAPPVRVPAWGRVAGGAGALLLLLAAPVALRAWRRRAHAPLDAPPLPPHDRLARQAAEIAAQELPRQGRGREHVARLAAAVRAYLAAVEPRAPLDLTSGELVSALRTHPVAGTEAGALERFLRAADLVKFAREEPPEEECRAALRFAQRLAETGRPRPAAPP